MTFIKIKATRLLLPVFLASMTVLAGVAGARADNEIAVGHAAETRAALMKSMDTALQDISDRTFGLFTYKQDLVLKRATEIYEGLEAVEDLFPDGSPSAAALPEIWTDPDGFHEKFELAEERAEMLIKVTKTNKRGSISKAAKRLYRACAGCHGKYRK